MFRDTSHREAVEAAPAVRTEDNEVRVPTLGFMHNFQGVTISRKRSFRARLKSGAAQDFYSCVRVALCILDRSCVEFLDLFQFEIWKLFQRHKRLRNRHHFEM